ncbi:hypothetical protein N9J26_01185 [bacterium]|nr:hypothetical protein [bacterium]
MHRKCLNPTLNDRPINGLRVVSLRFNDTIKKLRITPYRMILNLSHYSDSITSKERARNKVLLLIVENYIYHSTFEKQASVNGNAIF